MQNLYKTFRTQNTTNIFIKRTINFIKMNLTNEPINNVKIILQNEYMKNT